MTLALSSSLRGARSWLREHRAKGVICPVCDQHAQEYRWCLYSSGIYFLDKLYQVRRQHGPDFFVHSNKVKYPGQGGDGTRLRVWGLVEHGTDRREDGGKSGYWRITDKGVAFLLDQIRLEHKYAWVYNGQTLRFEGPPVGVREVEGVHFNYDEFVRRIAA